MNRILAFTLFAAAFGVIPSSRAANPIIQTLYTADPAPLVVGDTLYVYTGHDEDVLVNSFFTMKDWHVFSTSDMVNWTHLGSPLSLKDFNWAKSDAWAGQCIGRDGKFYFYVPINRKTGGMAIGVAVGESPIGPFKDPLGKPLVHDGHGDIDPTVFIDDDGQAYLAWGNPTYKYVKLNRDMISYDTRVGDNGIFRHAMTVEAFGRRTKDDRATSYEEGPWIYKGKKLYYLFFGGGPISEHAYSTGPSPEGPWTYGGIIMPTQGRSFTNHPGVVDYKGKTYLFYHNGALPGGSGFARSVCVDELRFNPDGSVVQMNMTTEGPAQLAPLDPYQRVEGETICWSEGIKSEPSTAGGMSIYPTREGAYTMVKGVDFGVDGPSTFAAALTMDMMPDKSEGGVMELHLDSVDGPLIGTVPAPSTTGDGQPRTIAVRSVTGTHALYLVFKGHPTDACPKLDYWSFGRKTPAARE